ncbi:MAG: protein kinase domain-containing protein [Planctomycetales bacterium]|jgi:CRP-like cAMP-binding protein
MNAGPQNGTANFAGSGLTPRSNVEFDIETLLQRPAAAEFYELSSLSPQPVDVFGFVHRKPDFTPQDCVDALLTDQHLRHGTETAVPAETYCAFLRNRAGESSTGFEWQIVAREFLLALQANESTSGIALQNCCTRFPEFQEQLINLSRSDGLSETLIIDSTCSFGSGHEPTVTLGPTQPVVKEKFASDPEATRLDFDEVDDPDQSSLAYEPESFVHDQSSLLGGTEPFSQLPPIILEKIEQRLEERCFQPDQHLIKEGDAGDGLYFLTDGRVTVLSSDQLNQDQEIARCGPGSILGEMALLTDQPRTASVVAATAVTAKFLPLPVFQELASDHPVIGQVLTQLLAQRLGQQDHDALSGKRFGRYRILQRLGKGGMAIVYEALDEQSGATVALKMMSHRLVYDANALNLFQSEARMIEAFEHPHIVRMLGRFKAFRSFFIVLEFCDGISLGRYVRENGPLPDAQFRKVIAQLAAALSYAHSKGIVHRDIKPSNAILTSSGDVKLMDFGLAKPVDNGEGSSSRLISGTPRFMAPEQLQGAPTDTHADLFALGCTAWKLLTGKELITDTRLSDIEARHKNWQLPDMSDLAPDVVQILVACLQVDPAKRVVDLDAVARWWPLPAGA